ncbi:cyclophilin type peptidyl-prolyl cis-trans isomerase, putative [Trypanosoma equiperdum]|uniref:Peptidyl-prolyl cis-trans isomerase n=4 Tax=Trypanozoon TaxID=39700 RepID=Q38DM0_TRYB2|nr:cyclophilin type peptidyl-prolyl cis-trans isomerase, putative [Trypanosoma brucei gambiense DAL972]XP_827430.1 cyclophilin type peptidyl-prolyl cis-trans isomerase, putative [Trypanosoma brucei brucei TREU927]RHW70463.1 cyclophilin type peptidyl-prolyl cis-trans isomerase [Trypanosoma brucei equiperdum]SCU68706.1 cyclophilin type peptidyl-prolyl cis-trans isomerase, putative [Trypanosoma equiperdum]EAN77100.1 cyclophilin type peptidyl-prolyl cis-trans isomerase, putative [Trypanosoma brucei|eukprot:XP_011776889.1 cyclophilin type peptidyl-prolyl cis-trans isomerase, putative [Trypanosoma brucei gambiense DAL972]
MSVVISTSLGSLLINLRFVDCPKASFNFLALCASSYYDGCRFHRLVPETFVLTGDPTGTGKGGESVFVHHQDIKQRYFEDEGMGNALHDRRGVVSMAHKGNKPDTNASQFFILFKPCPSLDSKHTAFGVVDFGWNDGESERTLKRVEELEADGSYNVLDVEARILSTTVLYNPFAEGHIKLNV